MSLNLVLTADHKGHTFRCDLRQTPTNITFELLKSDDVRKAYLEWYKGCVENFYDTTDEEKKEYFENEIQRIDAFLDLHGDKAEWGYI